MRFLAAGESALVVELGNAIDPALNARVLALDRALLQAPFDGYVEAVPSYRSLLVFFDPERASADTIGTCRLGPRPSASTESLELRGAPVYDRKTWEVARRIGATVEEVVRLLAGATTSSTW
jgi:allophanate hydrolase subunit 1